MKIVLFDAVQALLTETWAIYVHRDTGATAIPAYSSSQFMEVIEQQRPEWAVVLLNNVIDADPLALLLRAIRSHPDLKFVFLSGVQLDKLQSRLKSCGLEFDYKLIPIQPHELKDALQRPSMLRIADPAGMVV